MRGPKPMPETNMRKLPKFGSMYTDSGISEISSGTMTTSKARSDQMSISGSSSSSTSKPSRIPETILAGTHTKMAQSSDDIRRFVGTCFVFEILFLTISKSQQIKKVSPPTALTSETCRTSATSCQESPTATVTTCRTATSTAARTRAYDHRRLLVLWRRCAIQNQNSRKESADTEAVQGLSAEERKLQVRKHLFESLLWSLNLSLYLFILLHSTQVLLQDTLWRWREYDNPRGDIARCWSAAALRGQSHGESEANLKFLT